MSQWYFALKTGERLTFNELRNVIIRVQQKIIYSDSIGERFRFLQIYDGLQIALNDKRNENK